MKLKNLIVASALVALASQTAFAQTTIHVAASNGDRGPTQTAISKILTLGGNWTYQGAGAVASYVSSTTTTTNLSGAVGSNFGVWRGTYNGGTVVIKTSYIGAVGAIATVAGNTTVRYVKADGTGGVALADPTSPSAVLGTDYELSTADFGFSTNFQSTSPFQGTFEGITYATLTEDVVGVSPLGFYASPGFPTSAANITTQLAQLLYTTGVLPLAQFTGDYVNDSQKFVYALGRNTDAGQRFGAYTEIGLGTTASVKVWQPSITGANTVGTLTFGGTANSHIPWPEETVSNLFSSEGNGGYPSGATLAAPLTSVLGPNAYKSTYIPVGETDPVTLKPSATAGYYIGYLTPGDALTRVLGQSGAAGTLGDSANASKRGVALSYNGVKLHNDFNGPAATINNTVVRGGQYTAWVYNRLIRKPGSPSTSTANTVGKLADALKTQISTVDGVVGGGLLNDTAFKVKRSTEGGLVVPK